MLNILFGLIPEAIYFSLFIIFTKDYKKNRILFTILMTIGYIILKQMFPTNVYCQICYILYVPFIMKLTNKEKFHISDMFVFSYSFIILGILTILSYPFICLFNYIIGYIVNRVLMFVFLFIFKNKLNKVYKWIIPQWNRNRIKPNPIKALTIRNLCVIPLNISIFLLYLCMIFTSTQNIIR